MKSRSIPRPVFYLHSPITYTIGKAAISSAGRENCIVIGGRNINGTGIDATVEDDGCWSIERSCALLKSIADLVPATEDVALYLPHTSFLFGKLIKISDRVGAIHYIEEGLTSANPQFINKPLPIIEVELSELKRTLELSDLIEHWRIDTDSLEKINDFPSIAFDSNCHKYAGAFACSPDAFLGLPNVTRIGLAERFPGRNPQADLAVLPGIINLSGSMQQADLLCRFLLASVQSLSLSLANSRRLLVKLHPRDHQGLFPWFYQGLERLDCDYFRYCNDNGLDWNVEPALHRFNRYHIFGTTAMSKYISMFLGSERMICYDLPPQITRMA